eukprot:m.99264 g.99264  ORF g.99264 m.99264 type:complete len:82 (+) comp37056_c0_seq2:544-789(+)
MSRFGSMSSRRFCDGFPDVGGIRLVFTVFLLESCFGAFSATLTFLSTVCIRLTYRHIYRRRQLMKVPLLPNHDYLGLHTFL